MCLLELPPQQSCSSLFKKRDSLGGWVEVEICGMLLSKKLSLLGKREYPKGVGVENVVACDYGNSLRGFVAQKTLPLEQEGVPAGGGSWELWHVFMGTPSEALPLVPLPKEGQL